MYNRAAISDGPFDTFIVRCGGKSYQFTDLFNFAEIGLPDAGITQHVMKSIDKTYIHLIVVADDNAANSNGTIKGWYSASEIDKEMAAKIRRSWEVLREQPDEPTGPWAG